MELTVLKMYGIAQGHRVVKVHQQQWRIFFHLILGRGFFIILIYILT